MDAIAGVTCNTKGSPKGPLSNIEDGLEQSVSEQTKERIGALLERIESLSDVEKLLLYLKLPTGSASEDVLRQTPTSCLYASNRLEQAQAFTWIRSHLEEDSQICVPKHEVYDDYRLYCDSHRLKPLCPADFGKVLKCIFPNVKPRRLGQRGQSRYCYSGLRKKLDVQPPSLPDLEVSPKKPKREELQESEMMSASCQLVCEWAGRLLSRTFGGVGELAEFLVGNLYVNSKSTAAFTVLAALQDTAVNNSSGGGGGVCPLLSSSSGGDRHRETQLQLQRKLQERELLKEQKKKLQQQRNEIQQQQQLLLLRGTSTPTPTPTPSPQPRTFSKTPTPLRSPVGGRPPSSCLKSPTPTLSFRASGKGPTARNITRLLQSPLPKPSPHPFPPTKVEDSASHVSTAEMNMQDTGVLERGEDESGIRSASEGSGWNPLQATTAAITTTAAFPVTGHRLQKPVVMSRTDHQPILTAASSKDSRSQVTMTTTVSSSLPGGVCAVETCAATTLGKVSNLSTSISHFSSIAASASDSAVFSHTTASSRNANLLTGSAVDSLPSGMGSASSQPLEVSGRELCGSAGKPVSCAWSSVVSTPAAHTLTFVSQAGSGAESSSSEQSSVDLDTIIVPTSDPALLPGNMSARSAFVPVTNQKQSFTLMAPSTSTAVSESSGEDTKDVEDISLCMDQTGIEVVLSDPTESAGLHQRQADSLAGSGGFQSQPDIKAESGVTFSSSLPRSEASQNLAQGGRKGKNRFTPIRPKAPQPHPPPAKDEGVGVAVKDKERCRPVSALLKEKRAREAQEVLQHLASSFHQQHTATTTTSALPSTLTLPAEVLGLSGERGPGGGNEVVIILTSPSSSAATQRAAANPRLPQSEEKGWRTGCVARSMSDILIANPNFLQQKVAPPTSVPSSTPNTTSNNSGTAPGEKGRSTGPIELTASVVPSGSCRRNSDNWETGNSAADEEVTRHMTNAAHSSSHGRVGAHTPGSQTPTRQMAHTPTMRTAKTPTLTFRSTPTPTPTMQGAGNRKRKQESVGEDSPFVKRSVPHAQKVLPNFLDSTHSSMVEDPSDISMLLETESKNSSLVQDTAAPRVEDDDVFILDLPTAMPEPKSQSQGHQWVRPDVVGRTARRSDVVSPYPRPHSSTPLHLQMDRPISRGPGITAGPSETVSRCQSTGIELNEVMTRCLSTGIPGEDRSQKARASQAEDPSCHITGKLNLESMESDALLDSEISPPSQMPLMVQPSSSSRGMGEELAAAQRALLREKELLDARFHSFWTRLRSMDPTTPSPRLLGMGAAGQSTLGMTGGSHSQGVMGVASTSRQEDLNTDVFSSTPSYPTMTSSSVSFALETTSQSGGQMSGHVKPEQASFPSSGVDTLVLQSSGANICQTGGTIAEEQLHSVHLYPSDRSPQQVQAYPKSPFLMSPASGQLLADSLMVQSHSSTGSMPVHSDSSVGLNSTLMSTAGEEEKDSLVSAYGADRLSLDTFSMPSGSSLRTEASADPSSMLMEANSFSMDTTAFSMDSSGLSVDPNTLSMDSGMLSMDTNSLSLDTNPLTFDANTLGMETSTLSMDSNPQSVDSDTLSMAADHIVQLVQGLVSTQDTAPPQLPPAQNLTQVSSTSQPFQNLTIVSSTPQFLQGPTYTTSQTVSTCLASSLACVMTSSVSANSVARPVQRVSSNASFSSLAAINAMRSKSSGSGMDAQHTQSKGLASQVFFPSGRSKSSSSEPQPPSSQSDVASSEAPPPGFQAKVVKNETVMAGSRSKGTGVEVQPPASQSKGRGSQTLSSQSKGRSSQAPPPNTLLALLKSPVLSAISTAAGTTTSSRVWASKVPSSTSTSLPSPSSLTPTTQGQETSAAFSPSSVTNRPSFAAATSSSLFVTPAISHVAVSSVVDCPTTVASLGPRVSSMPVAQLSLQAPRSAAVVLQPSGQGVDPGPQVTPTVVPASKDNTENVGGELPLDVADFVTEHRLKVELQQQLQQQKQQLLLQQQQQKVQQGLLSGREGKDSRVVSSTTLLTEKELTALLLSQGGSAAVLTNQDGDSIRLAAARTHSAPLLQWSTTDPKAPLPMTPSTLTVTLSDQKNTFPVPSSPAPKQRLSESGMAGLKKHALLQRSASLPLSAASPTAEMSSVVSSVPVSSPSHDPVNVTSRRQAVGSGGVNGAVSRSSRESVTSPVCVSVVSPGEGGVSSVSSFVPIQGSPLSRGVGSRPLKPALTVPIAGGHRVVQTSSAPLTLVGIDQLTIAAPVEAQTDASASMITRPLTSSPRPGTAAYSAPSSRPAGVSPGPSPTPPSSHAYSSSPTPASQRPGGGQGVLQQLLSARGAPPSYAQTLQQRLLSSAMLSNTPIIRGAAQLVAGSAASGGKLVDGQHATATHRSSAESSVLVSVASILAEDVKPVAKALVHHIPCPTPSPPGKDASPASVASDRSPAPSRGERSPASSSIDRSPASSYKDRSPASSYKDRSPASSYKDRSPASSYKDRSPISSHKDRSPAPSRSERSPASNTKDRSPAFLSKDRSPAASHSERSPASNQSEKSVSHSDKTPAVPQKERSGRRASGQRRESTGRARLPSAAKLPPGVVAADTRGTRNASNPSSPADANDYSRPFSHKLQLLVLGDRGQAGVTAALGLQGGAVTEVPSSPAALSPSGRGVGGSLSVAVSSPATPGSLSSSAPSPASQGQGQGSVPTPGSAGVADVFFSVPPASPAPSPRVLHAFSPQKLSSSSSSTTTQSSLYLPFNLPDMNYMGSAPNIDLSQLLPAKTSPVSITHPSPSSSVVMGDSNVTGGGVHSMEERTVSGDGVQALEEHSVSVGGSQTVEEQGVSGVCVQEEQSVTGSGGQGMVEEGGVLSGGALQTLDELQSTLEILQGMDSHYFSTSELQGQDLLHNVLGHLTSDLQSPAPPCLEEDGEEEGGRKMHC